MGVCKGVVSQIPYWRRNREEEQLVACFCVYKHAMFAWHEYCHRICMTTQLIISVVFQFDFIVWLMCRSMSFLASKIHVRMYENGGFQKPFKRPFKRLFRRL